MPRRLLRVTMIGDWTVDTVGRLVAESEAAIRDMIRQGVRNGTMLTLIDMSGMSVAPAIVADRLGSMIVTGSPSRRIALAVGGALLGMQVKRLVHDDRVRLFADRGAALAWLSEGGGAATA